MVSDQELASCVESLIRQGFLSTITSVNDMVHQLEAKFGIDLSHKTSFIHEQINILLSPRLSQLPPTSSSERQHFSQICTGGFAAQMSQETVADAVKELPENRNHHQCLPPPPVAAPAPDAKGSVPAAPKRRGGPGGLSKICGVSPELQVIVGEPTMARTEIVKKLWAYIRKNNLQDPNNKRKIICNDELRLVFETDSTDMFKMNKLLAKHIIALEPSKEPGSDSKRLKRSDKEVDASLETQANQYPVVISDALAEFFGMGEREILQSDALKRIWDYIKAKRLEDSVSNMILCDAKLRQLFGCESLSASDVSEMLARHLFKQS